jgi:hypothetical protein
MPDGPLRVTSRAPHRTAAALTVALLVAACGNPTPSASPTGSVPSRASPTGAPSPAPSSSAGAASPGPSASVDPAVTAIYDKIEQQVVAIRGLQPTKPVARRFVDKAELKALLTADFDKDTPPDYLAANERLYKALGLIPADANLRDLSTELLGGGVVGFYRNDEDTLYVLSKSGQPGANERVTFAHEYDHALQDEHFTVFTDQKGILDQTDRIMARQAVYEGDATLLMTQWAIANLSQAELLEWIATSNDPEVAAMMKRMPAILRETLVYPYTTGLAFVQRAQSNGGWAAVDALYARMPTSTEQILHPEKYAANEAPVAVTLPADLATRLGAGWTIPLQDTFGEFQTGVWLRESDVARADATAAAAGWGGDRLAVVKGPGGAWALAWQTSWDTTGDATSFETAASKALDKAGGVARVLPGVGGKVRWVLVASNNATMTRVAGALDLAG